MLAKLWHTAQVLQPPLSASGKLYRPLRDIYMAGRHFSSPTIKIAEVERGRWLGSDRGEYQMSRTPDNEE